MVRIHPDPPAQIQRGAIAQLGERLLCKQEVTGSIPVGSTSNTREFDARSEETAFRRARTTEWCFFILATRSIDRLLFNNLG